MTIEPELIVACIKRERRAEYEMYKRTYSYLMSICIRYTLKENEAKEALNMGFLKILNNLHKYSLEIPFKRWIRKIMVNTLIDEFRKKRDITSTLNMWKNILTMRILQKSMMGS